MRESFPRRHFNGKPPSFDLCPRCNKGTFEPVSESFQKEEPPFSSNEHGHDAWEPEWIEYRFNFKCVCNVKACGEVAYVTGRGGVDQAYDYWGNPEWFEYFEILSFQPAPALSKIPDMAPEKVRDYLQKSFSLFWINTSAAANSIRASLEHILDDLKIPRTQLSKQEKSVPINLHQRIELAEKQKPELAELFFSLKEVGNLGSHGGTVTDNDYADALEIFSHVLKQLYENDFDRIKKLAQELKETAKKRALEK